MLDIKLIETARKNIAGVADTTPLTKSQNLSEQYQADIWLKREDLQKVRSYKIRGAYNKISQLTTEEQAQGVVCASAGNHAQGVAYACQKLEIKGKIFMPHTTPKQKVNQVRMFGKDQVKVILSGDNFDIAYEDALLESRQNQHVFIHPFDDELVMAGQGTTAAEILEQAIESPEIIFVPVGGGGLAAGMGSYLKTILPACQIVGVEPAGAPAMKKSLEAGAVITLDEIEKFVDGAAVKRVGDQTFAICREILDDMLLVPEGKVCTTMLKLYNEEAMVVEPAGALTIAALDFYREHIKGKRVVCVVSGGNNDIIRMEDIKERSLLYEGLKHYFIIRFPQRAGTLKEFLVNVLGPDDDITRFEYTKKNNRENGPALVGIELKHKNDFEALLERMRRYHINYQELRDYPDIFNLLV